MLVLLDRGDVLHEPAIVAPARDELVQAGGLERGAREVVVAGARCLLDDDDGRLPRRCGQLLLEADRRGQAGRTATDDQDVDRGGHARPSVARIRSGTTVSISPTMPKSA